MPATTVDNGHHKRGGGHPISPNCGVRQRRISGSIPSGTPAVEVEIGIGGGVAGINHGAVIERFVGGPGVGDGMGSEGKQAQKHDPAAIGEVFPHLRLM